MSPKNLSSFPLIFSELDEQDVWMTELEKVLRKEGCNEKTTMTSSKFLAKHED
jgi:hypothetical protein